MICNKCGSELIEKKKSNGRIFYRCPDCKNKPIWIESTSQWAPEQIQTTISGVYRFFGFLAIAVCSIVIVLIGMKIGGDKGIVFLSTGVTVLALVEFIFAAIKKEKRLMLSSAILTVFYYLLLLGAVNNFPEFIRRIQGEDFIRIHAQYSICIMVFAFLVDLIVCSLIRNSYKNKVIDMKYSDSDLMILQNFSSFRLTGYYLLKAKLHEIITFKTIPATADTAGMVLVELNHKLPKDKRDSYCQQNPQVRKIVELLDKRDKEKCEYTRIEDVVNNIKPIPDIQSEGGHAVNDLKNKLHKVSLTTFNIVAILIYCVACLKMLMGMHNNKPVEILCLNAVLLLPIMFIAFSVITPNFCKGKLIDPLIKRIVRKEQFEMPDFDLYVQSFLTDERRANEQDTQRILRYYATHEYISKHPDSSDGPNIAQSILVSISAAQALAKSQSQNSDGSGCSSCSGCGGCGGGCGGCGD